MKKIIFVTVSMRGGGTERVISILANCMVKMGYDVSIVMIAENIVEYELDNRIEVQCVSKSTGGSLLGRLKRIYNMRKVFASNRDAKIISMGTVANMFTLLASMGLPNSVTISERNDPNRLNHRPIKKQEVLVRNFLYKKADELVLQTPDVMDCFPISIREKAVVIPNPIPANLPKPESVERREKTIITAGRLTEQKNHRMLIEVFARFGKQFPEYTLKIFGRGELEEELQSLINEKQLQYKASLCGFSDDFYGELAKGGIYVSTSDWEGISNSLLEALAMGIPTIATDCPVGGTRMCIQDGVNGYMIAVKDEEALLRRLMQLAADENLRRSFSEQAIRIRDSYSEKVIVEKWI